jgi:hypothetical protein
MDIIETGYQNAISTIKFQILDGTLIVSEFLEI